MLKRLLFKDVFFQHRQAVRGGSEARALDVVGVVARAAVVVVLALADAIFDHHRKKRCRGVLGEHPVDVVADPHLGIDDEIKLPA